MRVSLALMLVFGTLIPCIVGPPVLPEEAKEPRKRNNEETELGLRYERYLKEVIESLEDDPEFREKLSNAKMEDITSGKIANELKFVDHKVRTKLDELKRREILRLRRLARQENELSNGVYPENGAKDALGIDRRMVGMPLHLDVKNEHTFEIADLRQLVQQTTKDLEEIDRQRRDEFRSYEMEKEHRRREELRKMDEDKRKLAEKEYLEKQKRHRDHPKLHHPGSKQQLEEAWEKDQMPRDEFDPLTFFRIYDMDGDEHWSDEEVKGVFRHELNKMYDQNNTDDDMQERREEMDRMREHVVNETDSDHDGLISLSEFLEMTKRNEFGQDPGWQGLDEQQMFREEEFKEYERQYQAGMIPPGGVPMYVPEGVHPGAGYQHLPPNPQMGGQQMYPPHQQGYPQGVPPGQYEHQVPNYQGGPPQYQQQQYQQGGYPHGQVPQYQGVPPQGQPQYQGVPPQGQPQYVVQQQGMPQPPNAYQQQQYVPVQAQPNTGQQQQQQQGLPQQQPPPPRQPQQQQQQQNLPNAQVPPQPSSSEHPQPVPPNAAGAEAVTAKQP